MAPPSALDEGSVGRGAAANKDTRAALSANPGVADADAATTARQVVLLAFRGVEVIDVAAPASAFSKAAERVPGSYRLVVASPAGGDVATNAGLALAGTRALRDVAGPIDTLVVAGGDEPALRAAILDDGVGAWIAAAAPGIRRIASVCTGAFALAAAGLLAERDATTHWRACELLQSLSPTTRVRRDRIYVNDGPVWTSAGVTTGLDLALALIEADLGRPTAVEIARNLALFMVRGGAEPQLSAALHAQADASSRLRELVAWIMGHLADDLSVEVLAGRACMSPRNFARAFAAETGTTPARFVERARVDQAAQLLLHAGWPQEKIAGRCGFGSVDALQRAFRRQRGMAPQDYRRRERPG